MSDNTAEEEEKITLSKKELQSIIDERVERKLQEQKSTDTENKNEGKEISRRSFLKKLGIGTVGLGALSLVPGSALNVRSDGFSFYGGSGSGLDFDVDNSGNIQIYGDLTAGGGETIWDESNTHIPSGIVQSSGLDADTVDGQEASDLGGGKSVQIDTSGDPYITATNTYTTYVDLGTSGSYSYFADPAWDKSNSYSTNRTTATGTIKARISGQMDYTHTLTISVDGSQKAARGTSSGSITTSIVTNIGSNQTLTFAHHIDASVYDTMKHTWSHYIYSGSDTFSPTSVGTSFSPGWLKFADNNGVNINGANPALNGQGGNRNSWVFSSITSNDTVSGTFSWTGASSTGTQIDLKIYGGSFIG